MRVMPVCRWGCDAFGSVEGGEGGHVADPGAQEGAEPRQRPHAAAQVRNHHPARQGGGSRRGECELARADEMSQVWQCLGFCTDDFWPPL